MVYLPSAKNTVVVSVSLNTEKTILLVARMPNGFDFSNVSFIICMSICAKYKYKIDLFYKTEYLQ